MIDVMTPGLCAKTASVHSFHCGSVPEIIDPGVTGHTISTMDKAIRMLAQVLTLDCRTVRQRFEQRFSGGPHGQRLRSGVPFVAQTAVAHGARGCHVEARSRTWKKA